MADKATPKAGELSEKEVPTDLAYPPGIERPYSEARADKDEAKKK